MITTLVLSSSLALLAPQVQSSGLLMESPTTLVANGTNGGEILAVGEGSSAAFNASLILPRLARASFLGGAAVAVNSLTRGRAYLPVHILNVQGEDRACARLGPNGWSFLIFSVTPDTTSATRPIYAQEGAGRGSAIFSYFIPGSESQLPSNFVNVVEKIRTGSEMQVTDVHAIDSYAYGGLVQQFPGQQTTSTPPPPEEINQLFFTITPGTRTQIPNSWVNNVTSLKRADTIFEVNWNGNTWSTPTIYKTAIELFPSDEVEVAIDALCIDAPNNLILLSTDENLVARELWIVTSGLNGIKGPYYDKDGQNPYVQTYLGINPNGGSTSTSGIDAACGDDPHWDVQVPAYRRMDWRRQATAMPLDKNAPSPYALPWSAHTVSKSGAGYFHFIAKPGKLSDTATLGLYARMGSSDQLVRMFTSEDVASDAGGLTFSMKATTLPGDYEFRWKLHTRGQTKETRYRAFHR